MRDRDKPNYQGTYGYSWSASGRGNGETGCDKCGFSNFANDDYKETGAGKIMDASINIVCVGVVLAASYFFVAQLITG